jgi:hypothetical protein
MFYTKHRNKFTSFLDPQADFQPLQQPETEPEPEYDTQYGHISDVVEAEPVSQRDPKYFPGERLLKKLAKAQRKKEKGNALSSVDRRRAAQQLTARELRTVEKSLQGLLNEF